MSRGIKYFLNQLSLDEDLLLKHIKVSDKVNSCNIDAHKPSDCTICPQAHLPDAQSFRAHFKSGWHVSNIKAHQVQQRMLSQSEYELSISYPCTEETREDSQSSSSEAEPQTFFGSPYIEFFKSTQSEEGYSVYKCILMSADEIKKRDFEALGERGAIRKRLATSVNTTWMVILIRSGRVACAVYDNEECKIIVSKTFKRYTTRRKQGGSQLKKDSSSHSIRSAGALIRRENELLLIRDTKTLLNDWKKYVDDCSLIFWNSTVTGMNCLEGSPIDPASDPRLRTIPFNTYKPSIEEVHRCYTLLNCIRPSRTL